MSNESEIETIRAERDLYRALLDLGTHDDLAPFLDEALGLMVGVAGAKKGYLALNPHRGATGAPPGFFIAQGCSAQEIDAIRAEISGGIIAEALRTGATIATASALEDPRFKGLASVQAQRIQAVLCAPIGGTDALGVLYLQGRATSGPFAERERRLAEMFALKIAPFAARLLHRDAETTARDHTAEFRSRLRVEGLIGTSRAMGELLKQMAVAAAVDVTVLLQGESGTGKTEVARAIHESSRRARSSFVEINCAALPENLLEAELFGAEKGAHSTATKRILGKISAADGGTLFLDEIAEIPIASQSKLLQFLQSRKYFRLGSDTPIEANVRIIVATNRNLHTAVREKTFREDLFYRINVLSIEAPPLRDRAEDIPLLANHLARQASQSFERPMTLTWAALASLSRAEWPGNIRQLAGVIQRGAAFALEDRSDVMDVRHLFPNAPQESPAPTSWQDALRVFQRKFLQESLDACEGNVSETARRLGLARSHLYELLRAHGLGRARPT